MKKASHIYRRALRKQRPLAGRLGRAKAEYGYSPPLDLGRCSSFHPKEEVEGLFPRRPFLTNCAPENSSKIFNAAICGQAKGIRRWTRGPKCGAPPFRSRRVRIKQRRKPRLFFCGTK